jgi:hypothetical protein
MGSQIGWGIGRSVVGVGQRVQGTAAAGLRRSGAVLLPGEEARHPLLHLGLAAQAGIGGDFFARPVSMCET